MYQKNKNMTNRQIIKSIKNLIATEGLKHVIARGFTSSNIYYVVIDNLEWETAAQFATRATGLSFEYMNGSMARRK